MKILETIQIGALEDGTFKVWSKSHDEVAECETYAEALQVFQQFLGGIMDVHHDFLVEREAFHANYPEYS